MDLPFIHHTAGTIKYLLAFPADITAFKLIFPRFSGHTEELV